MYRYDPKAEAAQLTTLRQQHAALTAQLADVTPDKLMVHTVARLRVEAAKMRLDGQRVGGSATKRDVIEFLCACRRRDLRAQVEAVERKIAEVDIPEYMRPPRNEWVQS